MSKIKKLIILISILIILTGCTESKIVDPIQEHDELPIEDEVVEESDNDKDTVKSPLQTIDVYSGSSVGLGMLNGNCWNKSADECTVTSENPREKIENESPLFVKKGEEIEIRVSYAPGDLRDPHRVEVIQYGFLDEEGKIIDSEIVSRVLTFSVEGSYFYLVHLVWDEAETQQAYYAFRTATR